FIRADDPLGPMGADAAAVLEELAALTDISDRLHLLAVAEDPDFLWPERTSLGRLVREAEGRWRALALRDWRIRIDAAAPVAAAGRVRPGRARMAGGRGATLGTAVQPTPAGGRIAITVPGGGPVRARLTVADAGRGIPADRLPGLLEPFGSPRPGAERRGSGLGLAGVRAVVEAHGGGVAGAGPGGFGPPPAGAAPGLRPPAREPRGPRRGGRARGPAARPAAG